MKPCRALPASCSLDELLASRLARMGFPYRAANWRSVPRKPGIRKSKRDHSSRTLFYIGDSVREKKKEIFFPSSLITGSGNLTSIHRGNRQNVQNINNFPFSHVKTISTLKINLTFTRCVCTFKVTSYIWVDYWFLKVSHDLCSLLDSLLSCLKQVEFRSFKPTWMGVPERITL